MPESVPSLPEVRCGALDDYFKRAAPETKYRLIKSTSPIGITKTRGRRARTPSPSTAEPAPSRRPGSSVYYGVRFRPDLNKWVAEIRVAEWKAVDKKVWLGTFDTEQGAARGVDLARKLLKCQKKHDYNLPCPELEAYQGRIPANLILTEVTASHMFKAATLFIKRECQDYAAKFTEECEPALGLQQLPSTSFESEVVDELGADSDHEESRLVPEPTISVNDYLNEQDVYSSACASPAPTLTSVTSFASAASFSSDASFDHFLYQQHCLEMPDLVGADEMCEFGHAAYDMVGGVQGPECSDFVHGPSSAFALPGSYCETMPFGAYLAGPDMEMEMNMEMGGGDVFQNIHNYPFQHGSMSWY